MANIVSLARRFGFHLDKDEPVVKGLYNELNKKASLGYDYASAEASVELLILRKITSYLRIEASNFAWECERRGVSACTDAPPTDANPYEVLGCDRHATDEEVKRAYREKAKQLHPDVLRAQGLSDELISKANDQMARINAAWSSIRQERGI